MLIVLFTANTIQLILIAKTGFISLRFSILYCTSTVFTLTANLVSIEEVKLNLVGNLLKSKPNPKAYYSIKCATLLYSPSLLLLQIFFVGQSKIKELFNNVSFVEPILVV